MGKAKNLKSRVSSYFTGGKHLGPKTRVLVSKIADIEYVLVQSELEALILEANLIKKFSPPYNISWKDGKSYPFIRITASEFPAVLQARKLDDPKSTYFGPYPNIGDVRQILKTVRRIFPYISVRNHAPKICLYHHLGQCPCPNVNPSPEKTREYKQNIRHIEQFLEGKRDVVKKSLEKEMMEASKREDYDLAARLQKQLKTIEIITAPTYTPREYIQNPNLLSDEGQMRMDELKMVLKNHGLVVEELSRIECYDISNISGTNAVGSMVVATNGIIDKSQYRRFRVMVKNTPDDFAMHKEVMKRRLKHIEDWGMPSLLVIDGGAGQVNAAHAAIVEAGMDIPIVGLAKKLEEIYVPKHTSVILRSSAVQNDVRIPSDNFQSVGIASSAMQNRNDKNIKSMSERSYKDFEVVRIPKRTKALQLLMSLRNEAHRFAISYHRKLRSKAFLTK